MLLTISTTESPATDLGYLLHKHPGRVHQRELAFGRAVMFYPESGPDRCTFAMHVDVDPVRLVRGRDARGGLLDQYVNDRPYAASSLLAVAVARCLGTALGGRSKERPELAEKSFPFEASVTPVPVRGQMEVVERLFRPLGYDTAIEEHTPYIRLSLAGDVRLKDLLSHLYVLVPVLDNSKHYWFSRDEVDKLLEKGAGWLEAHPEQSFIVTRYLKRRSPLVREALARLSDNDAEVEEDARERKDSEEEELEKPIRLNDRRMTAVADMLAKSGATRVVDLGCGEGRLVRELFDRPQFKEIVGVDTSIRSLERAERRLKLDRMTERQRSRVQLLQGALTYRDDRLRGFDAAALVEVIEHVDVDRLPALERAVFETMHPDTLIVTTPNREYNVLFEGMTPETLRHRDHRFEWTRAEFLQWSVRVAKEYGYEVRFDPIGDVHDVHGPPTQMATFTLQASP